jgi:pyridoxine kinase
MSYKRILTIQDISCVGQCSLTVALPILSACGLETAIIPSAVLSTHTMGFEGFTCRDLADDIPKIAAHWKKEGIDFDAVYTGYLGSKEQIGYVMDIFDNLLKDGGERIVDPAMADFGQLYPAFDMDFVEEMKKLVFSSDLTLPNITEAAFLTGIEFREKYDEAYIDSLLEGLRSGGAKTIVLTGVSYDDDTTGIVVYEGDKKQYYRHEKLPVSCHGTGDVYASAFVGAYVSGKSAYDSAKIAGDYTVKCIKNTVGDKSHWYGVKFEPLLGDLIESLK